MVTDPVFALAVMSRDAAGLRVTPTWTSPTAELGSTLYGTLPGTPQHHGPDDGGCRDVERRRRERGVDLAGGHARCGVLRCQVPAAYRSSVTGGFNRPRHGLKTDLASPPDGTLSTPCSAVG
jgi:hypothetical protein